MVGCVSKCAACREDTKERPTHTAHMRSKCFLLRAMAHLFCMNAYICGGSQLPLAFSACAKPWRHLTVPKKLRRRRNLGSLSASARTRAPPKSALRTSLAWCRQPWLPRYPLRKRFEPASRPPAFRGWASISRRTVSCRARRIHGGGLDSSAS